MKLSFLTTSLALLALATGATASTTYYIATNGSDSNNDGQSTGAPWRSFNNVNGTTFQPGDQILLRRGDSWTQAMTPLGNGTSTNKITLGTYGSSSSQPTIQRSTQSIASGEVCLDLSGLDNWIVQDIRFNQAHTGILCDSGSTTQSGIEIRDCLFENMDDHSSVDNPCTGIRLTGYSVDDILVSGCTFHVTTNGLGVSPYGSPATNLVVENCEAYGGWNAGFAISFASGAVISAFNVHDVGGTVSIGTCGGIVVNSEYVLVTDCSFSRVRNGTGGDGLGFDFEANNHHCTLTRSYFFENASAAINMFSPWPWQDCPTCGPQPNTDITISDCLMYNNNTNTNPGWEWEKYQLLAPIGTGPNNEAGTPCSGQIVNCGSYIVPGNATDHFSDNWVGNFTITGMIEGTHRSGWIPVYGEMKQVAVGGNDNTWALTPAGAVRSWTGDYLGDCWNTESGTMANISAGNDGEVWATDSSHGVWQMSSGSWVSQSGPMAKVAVGSGSRIWSFDTFGVPNLWNGSGWTTIGGETLTDIDVGPSSTARPWGVASNTAVRYNNSSWVTMGHSLTSVSSGSSSTAVGINGTRIWLTTDAGANWTALDVDVLSQVSMGSDGVIWGTDSENHVWRLP